MPFNRMQNLDHCRMSIQRKADGASAGVESGVLLFALVLMFIKVLLFVLVLMFTKVLLFVLVLMFTKVLQGLGLRGVGLEYTH